MGVERKQRTGHFKGLLFNDATDSMPQLKLPQFPCFFKTSLEWCCRTVTIGLLSFMLFSNNATATHIMGNDISYRYIDSQKYEVTFRFYRDCRSIGFSDTQTVNRIRCISGSNKRSLKLKLVSITDITPVCDSVSSPCSPANTFGTGKGIEMHVYRTIVDFSDTFYKPLLSCDKIIIETSVCCRSGAITTCGANKNFYNYAMLDVSAIFINSSPVIESVPEHAFLCCNQPVYQYFDVHDYDDCDSLSYNISFPLDGSGGVNCFPYSYKTPFRYYDPFGSGQTYPNASPPIGFYFDQVLGGFIVTPTQCGEVTPVPYEVREWRKDTAGVYQNIGIIRREMVYWVESCPGNHPPIINGPYSYSVCEGEIIAFNITTDDRVYVPPPPAPKPDPDTVTVSWNTLFSDATLRIVDTTAQLQAARFRWQAKLKGCTNNTYTFTLYARDNHCPRNAISSRTFTVRVKPKPRGSITVDDLSCGYFGVRGVDLENVSTIQWQVLDTSGAVISDTSVVKFLSSNRSNSARLSDTLFYRSNDIAVLRARLMNGNCDTIIYDSLLRVQPHYKLFSWKDTLLCDAQRTRLYPDLSDSASFKTFQWSTGADDTFYSILVQDSGVYELKVRTLEGCDLSERIVIRTGNSPDVLPIPSDSFCPPFMLTLNVDSFVWDGGLLSMAHWENGDSTLQRDIDSQGNYYLLALNQCGSDTSFFNIYAGPDPKRAPVIEQQPDDTLCLPFSLMLDARQITDSNDLPVRFQWENGDTAPMRSIISEGIFRLTAINKCGTDSMFFRYTKDLKPQLAPIPDDTLCIPDSIEIEVVDLQDSGITIRTYQWDDNLAGPKRVIREPGQYQIVVSSLCGADTGSFTITGITAPSVDLGPDSMVRLPFKIRLTADTVDASYQWSTGDTNSYIFAEDTGTYWVTVSNYCGISSDTIHFSWLTGISSWSPDRIQIMPNPFTDAFEVHLDKPYDQVLVRIRDVSGREVFSQRYDSLQQFDVHFAGAPGAYLIEVYTGSGRFAPVKIFKE